MKKFYMMFRYKDKNNFDCYKKGYSSNDLLGLRAEIACRFYEGRLNGYDCVWIAERNKPFYISVFDCIEYGEMVDKFFERG